MSSNLLLQLLPTEINLDALKIKQRQLEQEHLRGLAQFGEQTFATLKRLEREIKDLESEKTDYLKSYNDAFAKLSNSTCLKNTKEK